MEDLLNFKKKHLMPLNGGSLYTLNKIQQTMKMSYNYNYCDIISDKYKELFRM